MSDCVDSRGGTQAVRLSSKCLNSCQPWFLFLPLFNFIPYALVFRLCQGVGSPGAVVADSWELCCGSWELNPAPLEEQPVLLNSEPSLQPLVLFFLIGLLCVPVRVNVYHVCSGAFGGRLEL